MNTHEIPRMLRQSEKTNPVEERVVWAPLKSLWFTFHALAAVVVDCLSGSRRPQFVAPGELDGIGAVAELGPLTARTVDALAEKEDLISHRVISDGTSVPCHSVDYAFVLRTLRRRLK